MESSSTVVNPASAAPARVGFWPRVGAALIDTAVIWIVGAILSRLVAPLFPEYIARALAESTAKLDPTKAPQMQGWIETVTRVTTGVILFHAVYSLAEGLVGRAVGKLALGLRIAGADGRRAVGGDGRPPADMDEPGQIWVPLVRPGGRRIGRARRRVN